MSAVNLGRALQVSSDVRALTFEELDSSMAEVFRDNNVGWAGGFLAKKTLGPGANSHDFPMFGGSAEDADYHVAGTFIQGGTTTQSVKNIAVDDPLLKALRFPWIDQQLSKWSIAEPYMRECVRKVAELLDYRFFRLLALATRTAAVSGVHNGGYGKLAGTAGDIGTAYPRNSTGATAFLDDLSYMAQTFDENNIPKKGRTCFISPYIKAVITRDTRVMNRDYMADRYGISLHERVIGVAEGWNLVETNHLPSTAITADLTKYNGDFTYNSGSARGRPAGLCCYVEGDMAPVGGVMAGGLINTVYWDENRETWMTKAKILNGMDVLFPWLAGEIYCHS